MSFLKIKRIEIEDDFVERGKISISDKDIQKLNNKIRENIRANNDERIITIEKMNLLNSKFK